MNEVPVPAAVLYTLVDRHQLLGRPETAPGREVEGTAGAVMGPREAVVGHRRLLLQAAPDGSLRVQRLISTDPADYLDPRWQPGAAFPIHLL